MKKILWNKWICLLAVLLFAATSCSKSLIDAENLLRQGKKEEALNIAIGYLDKGEVDSQLDAIKIVTEIGGKKAAKALMEIWDDSEEEVRVAAIVGTGTIGYKRASNRLIEMIPDAEGDTYDAVAKAIGLIDDPATDILMKRLTKAKTDSDRKMYMKMVKAVGSPMASAIAKTMANKSFFENRDTLSLLSSFKSPTVPIHLLKQIDNEEVAPMVVEGLIMLGTVSAAPVVSKLREISKNQDQVHVMERLIEVLGKVKDPMATGILEELSKHENERVRNAVENALRGIRGF